jgi:hypothetical protein
VASLTVTVAAYGSLEAATADWDDVAQVQRGGSNLLDAALIEWRENRVAGLHRCPASGWAQGSVASALVGRLSPPALLDGPLAGGVGKRVLSYVSTGLSRDAVNELGRVLESGRFVTLAVVERGGEPKTFAYWSRALRVASLPMQGTAFDLRRALEDDEADG